MKRFSTVGPLLLVFVAAPLAIAPACGGGGSGGGGGTPPPPDASQSSLSASVPFGTPADGATAVRIEVTLADANGDPLAGRDVELVVSGYGNQITQPNATDAQGETSGTVTSTIGERKRIVARIDGVELGPITVEFLDIPPDAFFVRASGSDASSGRSPIEAWATLAHALTQLGPGDVLHVGAGLYQGPLTLAVRSADDDPFILRGDIEGCWTGDAGEVTVDAGGAAHALRLDGTRNVVLRGITLGQARPGAGAGGALHLVGAERTELRESHLTLSDRGLDVDGAEELTVATTRVSGNDGTAIALSDVRQAVLQNLLVYANAGPGLVVEDVGEDLTVELSTFYRNTGDQLREDVAGSTGVVRDNVFSEGGANGLVLAAGSTLDERSNLSWAHAGADFASSPGPGSIVADPLLLAPAGNDGILGGLGAGDDDLRVAPASPTIDASARGAHDVLIPGLGSLAISSNRSDDVPDGTDPDGPAANWGFHYPPLPLEPFESLAPGEARVAFARSGEPGIHTRSLDREADEWRETMLAQRANAEVTWLVLRTSPVLRPEELLGALVDTGTRGELWVLRWDGRKWSGSAPLVPGLGQADAQDRSFDLAYEQTSGEALLVHGDGSGNPLFRTLAGDSWSDPAPVFPTPPGMGRVFRVELVAEAQSDRIALVFGDDLGNVSAAVWDGAAWSAHEHLGGGLIETTGWQAFDAAWESQSGDLLVAWADDVFLEETNYALLPQAGGSWTFGRHNSSDSIAAYLELASDPTSDRIAGLFGEGPRGNDVNVTMWNGTSFVDTRETTLEGLADQRSLTIGWLGESGQAIAVWRDADLAGDFDFALFDGGWRPRGEVMLPGLERITHIESHPLVDDGSALLIASDEAGALFALEYDGTWSVVGDGTPLATDLDTSGPAPPFAFDVRRP